LSLLLDENLSPRLIQRLSSLFPGLVYGMELNADVARAHLAPGESWWG